MKTKLFILMMGIICYPQSAWTTAGTKRSVYAKKILPPGCVIKEGSKRDGYSLKCKKTLPSKIPKWNYKGIDLIPIDKEEFIERSTWTHTVGNDEWYLIELVRCNPKRCFEPEIRLIFGDHCGAP